MVKRRGGRRASTIKIQPSKVGLEESDSIETVSPPPSDTSTETSKTISIDPFTLSRSKLEGLVSEKSLYVKVVDIQKSNSKVISGVNFNISSLTFDDQSTFKIQTIKSGENSKDNLNIGSSMSANRKKAVGVVSRVVTRSRRMAVNSNTVIDKVTTVGITKTSRRTNKNNVKQNAVKSGSNEEASIESKQSGDAVKTLDNFKMEPLSQTEDDDPCLSGDIMYEQVIEDDIDEPMQVDDIVPVQCDDKGAPQTSVEIPSVSEPIPRMTSEQDVCIKPSSTSDPIVTDCDGNVEENASVQLCDESKVTSSSGIIETTSCSDECVESVGNNSVSTESSLVSCGANVSATENLNIKALSSLKLDPGVEPVSSSKTELFFEPIFSIDDNSAEQVQMEVDSHDLIIRSQERGTAVEEKNKNSSSDKTIPLKQQLGSKETNLTEDAAEATLKQQPLISYEKIVTRSRSGVNSSTSKPNVTSSSPVSNKAKTKKKGKSDMRESNVEAESSSADSSSKDSTSTNTENDSLEVLNEKKMLRPTENIKDCNNGLSDTNDSDTPLVVNRCITDETRKYMGPKGIIKNNYCSSVEPNDSIKPDAPSKSPTTEICSSSNTDVEPNSNILEKTGNDIVLPVVNDKNVPISPKELFMKNYSSQINNLHNSTGTAVKINPCGGQVLDSDNEKTDSVICEQSLKKNDNTDEPDDPPLCSKVVPINVIKTTSKDPERSEQNIRRSRRNSVDKIKRSIMTLSTSPKEKKESTANKIQNFFDSNVLIDEEKCEKSMTTQGKQDVLSPTAEKSNPGRNQKAKSTDKTKKEVVTMSSILNEKLKPMSPKELIKKSFIANESRSMEPPAVELVTEKNALKIISTEACTDDNDNDVGKAKMSSSVISCSTEQVSNNLNDFRKTEFVIDKGKFELKTDNAVSNSSLMSFDSDKPVKVKSRWRRTSELEMGKMVTSDHMDIDSSSRLSFGEDSKSEPEAKTSLSLEEEKINDDAIVAQRMNSFIHIDSNEYLTERYISKETKRMVCDCTLTKEEIAKGEKGCGEDCLNRLLLIECGSRCPLGKLCSNKCFVNRDYSECKVVNMANKGMGVISAENISSDQFIMEYVGEVLNPKEFRKRAKEYSKDNVAHFYFMSLKADTVIDATHKGNISRFINHSCDPNAETQKWTVNGELRIGFFSKRPIAVGEEITFDYQLERYGKEAQKCYCGSANCRGWLGQNPDNDESEEDSDEESEESSEEEVEEDVRVDKDKVESQEKRLTTVKIKKEKKKLPARRKEIRDTTFNPDGDLEDEIDKLSMSGVKNQKHTLALSRLIVRATEERSRTRLLELIKTAATPCLRLFLDYHGLNLLWSWTVDPRSNNKLKSMIMDTLFVLPIQNKTMLKDSKVLSIIEKWASIGNNKASGDCKERGSTEEENSNSPREEGDDRKGKDYEKENRVIDKNEDFSKSDKIGGSNCMSDDAKMESEMETFSGKQELVNQASKLLEDWGNLKEEFRIPRKERVEQMKEHERQADMEYSDPRENQSYNRRRFRDRKESRFDKVREGRFDPKKEEWNPWQNQMGKMSKAERRQLFAERVKREEREKREAEELWKNHQEQCKALGVNPSQTAMFHPQLNALAFYHKETNCWMPYQEGAESYGGGDGGVVVDHHQPPPHYQLDYQSPLPPGGPAYYQQGYQPVFGQFNQALLFQPPPPPPPQQFNVPPHPSLPPHPNQPLPPHFQPPLPQGQPLLQPGYVLPQGPPLIQQGPPLLPPHGPLPPHHGPPLPQQGPHLPQHGPPLPPQHCPPLPPQHGPPLPLPHGPPLPLPHGPPIPPQHCPPLPAQPGPPLSQQQGIPLPPPQGHSNFHQGFPGPLQGPPPQQVLTSHPASLSQSSHSSHIPLPVTPQLNSVPQPGAPPLPQQPLNSRVSSQQSANSQESNNSMEVQAYSTEQLQISSVPLKLPPKWKTAKDKEGRLYYYHVKKRVSQWIFPYAAAAAAFNSEPTSDSSSEDSSLSSSEEDEDEEEEEEEDSSEVEQENTAPTTVQNEAEELEPDSETLSAKKRKHKRDDVDVPFQAKKPKETGSLVSTIIIPREEATEMIGITKKKIRDNKEKVKREKARAARLHRHQAALQVSGIDYSSVTASVSSKCEADTSSGPKRKIKEIFMLKMANVVVASLNQYRKHDCKVGRITSTKDFKALAKKLTHFIMVKELRHCVNVEDLDCNDNVKHKARDFIRKYMSKYGPVYVNPKED